MHACINTYNMHAHKQGQQARPSHHQVHVGRTWLRRSPKPWRPRPLEAPPSGRFAPKGSGCAAISGVGCFCKLGVLFVDVLIRRSLLLGVFFRAPVFWKLPFSAWQHWNTHLLWILAPTSMVNDSNTDGLFGSGTFLRSLQGQHRA